MKKQKRNRKRPVEKYFQPKVAVHDRRERKMPNLNSSSEEEEVVRQEVVRQEVVMQVMVMDTSSFVEQVAIGGRRRSGRRINRNNNRMAPAANPGSILKLL